MPAPLVWYLATEGGAQGVGIGRSVASRRLAGGPATGRHAHAHAHRGTTSTTETVLLAQCQPRAAGDGGRAGACVTASSRRRRSSDHRPRHAAARKLWKMTTE